MVGSSVTTTAGVLVSVGTTGTVGTVGSAVDASGVGVGVSADEEPIDQYADPTATSRSTDRRTRVDIMRTARRRSALEGQRIRCGGSGQI
jgi:hypothetical protein